MRQSLFSFTLLFQLAIASTANAAILNSSFEDGLTHWNATRVGASFGYSSSPGYVTDGSKSARMWSHTTCLHSSGCGRASFSTGDYIGLSQSLDFTNITAIQFDSQLSSAPGVWQTYQSFTQAAAYIGSTRVWSEVNLGQYLNIAIDTTLFSGLQLLEFRIETTGSGVDYKSDHLYIDNLQVTEINAVPIPAAGFLFAPALFGLMGLRRKAKISATKRS